LVNYAKFIYSLNENKHFIVNIRFSDILEQNFINEEMKSFHGIKIEEILLGSFEDINKA
jgi:hypothetical protein